MRLTDFLLARIAEEEERARKAGGVGWFAVYLDGVKTGDDPRWILDSNPSLVSYEMTTEANARHAEAWSPARVLAECEAKREMLGLLADSENFPAGDTGWHYMKRVARLLARSFADHPDYDPDWAA